MRAARTGEGGECMNTNRGRNLERDIYTELAVVFCIFVALGFPGQFVKVYGEKTSKIFEYAAFILEIALIVTSHAATWDEIELLNLKRKYVPMYLFVGTVTVVSMLVTSNRSDELITCVRWIVTMLFAIWLQEYFSMENLLRLIAIAQGAFMVMTLYFIIRYPYYRYDPEVPWAISGLVGTKNGCATECVFGILITILLIRNEHRRHRRVLIWLVLVGVQGAVLLMADATGALLTLAVSLIPALLHRRWRLPIGLMYVTVNIVFLFAMLTFMPLFSDFLYAIGKDPTLTGRIPLWRQIIEVMSNHKTLTGYGFGMFWRDPIGVSMIHMGFNRRHDGFMASMTSGAHNVLMEMWLNIGLLGIAAFFYALLRSFRRIEEMDEDAYLVTLVVMVFLMVNGLTERCLGSNYDYKILALFLAMAIGCNKRVPIPYTLRGKGHAIIEGEGDAIPEPAV